MTTFVYPSGYSPAQTPKTPKPINKACLVIPPATELFPDTYHYAIETTEIFVCILSPLHKASEVVFNDNVNHLTDALEKCGYDTKRQLKIKRFSKKDDLLAFLSNVDKMNFTFASAILLFWFGETDAEGSNGMIALHNHIFDIRDLWKPFVDQAELQSKPKINLFFTYLPNKSAVQTDSKNLTLPKPIDPYESPKEADVLIIFQITDLSQIEDESASYVKNFSTNMAELGRQYHISNLASIKTVTDPSMRYPIVVSTLTRKFFMQPSQHRGIHMELDDLTKGVKLNLNIIQQSGNKRTYVTPRSSMNTAPTTRRNSKDNVASPVQGVANTKPADGIVKKLVPKKDVLKPGRSRTNSVSKQGPESKPIWKP